MEVKVQDWLDSVYSDGTEGFVSDPDPDIGDKVIVAIRMYEDAPVKRVFLRRIVNGAEEYPELKLMHVIGSLAYYAVEITVNEINNAYHFILVCDRQLYFYTQAGITTYIPACDTDFVIRTDHVKPAWVDGAVFYQIFPERFACGRPELSVQTGEYEYMGHECIHMDSWDAVPLSPDKGMGMDFYGGDLYGIIDRIPYLKELGITAVYLNPIFASYSTHKYDCIDYFHVDEHFGGDEALAKLSEALHAQDIKLILDISINHTGIRNKWIKEKEEFYLKDKGGRLKCWCGFKSLPVLDYRNEELRELIYRGEDSVLRKWLKPPYSIDGWRFDVADVFARNDDIQLADELWPKICRAIREEKPDAFIIGEHWGDCNEYLHGDMWNTPMNYFGYGRVIRQFVGLKDLFLERNPAFDEAQNGITAKEAVCMTARHYDRIPQAIADCQMNLFDSHDISRLHNNTGIGFEEFKTAVISQLMWTGIPCIYYGDEKAIDGYAGHDAGCRYPMPWDKDDEACRRHMEVYTRMIRLRKNEPAFAKGGRKVVYAEGRILAVARFMHDNIFLGLISMEDEDRYIRLKLDTTGGTEPIGNIDEFGETVEWMDDDGMMGINVRAHASYVIRIKAM